MKTVTTPKGTALPLTNLKGKDYLMVAYRLQWLNEAVANFDIMTEILKADVEESIVKSTVVIFDKDGKVVKRASATKRETKKDFPDHLEKAETSSIGRALAMLGYGTQFALADLDEGDRIVDSPVSAPIKKTKDTAPVLEMAQTPEDLPSESTRPARKSSFRKTPKVAAEDVVVVEAAGFGE